MPVTALPNLDLVYAKWEQRGPKGVKVTNGRPQNQPYRNENRYNSNEANKAMETGRKKWQDKFAGQNIKPTQRRRTRERRVVAVPIETIQSNTIAQFKTTPTILPEQFLTNRPFMGQCCSCMPNSQKDLISSATKSEGMRNILDVRHELRGSGPLSRQFANLVYSWRTRTNHKYPELSMAVLSSQRVIDVIQEELLAEEVKRDQAQLEKRAKEILSVMKSKISNALTKFTGWFLQHFFSLMLGGIHVHKGQMKMVKAASQRGLPMLFLPLHKSHLDYIIITYILWNHNIKNPNIAAGDNLNIPFFSFLMRGLGGYFIRRKMDKEGSKKDSIYRAVLHSYMEQLLSSGETLEFFLEGGRSRSGKALHPKGGLLSVVVDSLSTGIMEDVLVTPVSISYEKLLDGNYNNEQMGIAKKKESFVGAVKGIWNVLRGHYGSVRVDFAQPFSLKECLQSCQPPLIRLGSPESSSSETSMSSSPPNRICRMSSTTSLYGTDVVVEAQRQLVSRLGQHVVHTCVQTTAIMCTNLLAFLLLTKHRQGTTLRQLIQDYALLREEVIVRKRDIGFAPSSSIQEVVCYASALLGPNNVQKTPGKDQLVHIMPVLDIPNVFELSYYGNQVISVFLLESILVNSVIYLSDISLISLECSSQGEVILMSRDEVLEVAEQLSTLLKYEFIFVPPCCSLAEALADTLDGLVTSEVLKVEDSQQFDAYHNTFDKQWATRLSASLSWAEEGDDAEEEYFESEQLIRVNLERDDCKDKLQFFHKILAPFFEAYLVTGHNISKMMEEEVAENDFMKKLHSHAVDRVHQGVASYGESAALETLKNALRSYKDLKIVDSYCASNLHMLELHHRYDAKSRLDQYLNMLESLRE